ncbi:hypothetical protein SDJN03_20673, partial [Cucurbita argyrosperma subsp. sororia]
MNQSSHGFFFFFFFSFLFIFLLFSQSASARFPAAKQGLGETHEKLTHGGVQADSWPDFPHIIGGREKGEEEEEGWEKRKMMLEAHLDYVYTQNVEH